MTDMDPPSVPGLDEAEGLRQRPAAASLSKKETPTSEKSPKEFSFLNGFTKLLLPDLGNDDADGEEDEDRSEDGSVASAVLPKTPVRKPLSQSAETSPSHSWKSNSSCNLFEDETEAEGEEGDCDDYEYDPYTHEYVPRIRDPPEGEDSDDGLLICRDQRNASLSAIAQALLDSARVNQANHDRQKAASLEPSFIQRAFSRCQGSSTLKKIEEMPLHLQFNKHIHSGYRDLQDFWGCVFSVGYIHNETMNLLTHVAPIIYILLYWRTMYPWDEILGNTFLNCLGWSHIVASISPWIGSVIYHLFMSHHNGENIYQLLLQIDMFGIWITECFGALTNLSAAAWCLPKNFQTGIMTAYGLAAVWGLQKALTAWTPVARRMCFAPVFISRILAFVLRLSPWGGGDTSILTHVILQDVLSIAGGVIGVIRIPEKWFPGKLDLIFNSHHIMHILVVVAVCHMNLASNGDIRWIINNYTQSQCIQF